MGVVALCAIGVTLALASLAAGARDDERAAALSEGCDLLHRARLGHPESFAPARSAFRRALGRFTGDRAPSLGLHVVDTLEARSAAAREPFLSAIARGDDRAAEETALSRGGAWARDGARLATCLAGAARRANAAGEPIE